MNNRVIKFRAWDESAKMMLYPQDDNGWVSFFIAKLPDIMQFTGLLSKSGKEIYEGDIMKTIGKETGKEIVREVKWSNEGAAFYTHRVVGWPAVMVGEIIGNIKENPSLIQ